ncbi:MAG: prolyl oligopeptidase family serine peptidase [Flavobacterium sp. JAD_PAG50586_2]|nr:MAG: prolyl oligopeptidase family serine peptidase [Flavobacterium sp. JAD_PAG50586_2]
MTNGREKGIVFRLVSKSPYGATDSASNGVLDLNAGLLLQAVSDSKSGYFSWDNSKGLQQIVFENNRIGWLKHSTNGAYIYVREHYHVPPQLVYQFRNNKPKLVYQSNTQQQHYEWGFSKLITYENSKGKVLNGALFYPAGYDADKKYPMVVHIYERLSDYYNQYVNPTLLNSEGFNISILTTNGYFVLLPDIAYEEGEPGSSAVDCVTAAVDEVLEHESVDPQRLGIFGHSFGGYETNFIITQTNKFAAAISGAGISDIISSYLTIGRTYNTPNNWRYEYNQFRMGVSLFEGYDKYLKNSPVTFAKNVETPILVWTGEADKSVDHNQSLELHLALRRLQKPSILLLYEGGGHSLIKMEHQIDLTHRTQDWWDYYLKGTVKPDWLNPDSM